MFNILFAVGVAVFFALVLPWAFRALPNENRQILASVPLTKDDNGTWHGLNLTYYGLMLALGSVVGVGLIFVLHASVGIPRLMSAAAVGMLLLVCVPMTKIIARVVEKKMHTFTVGGASFVGIVIAPVVLWATDALLAARLGAHLPIMPALSAVFIAYAVGEGIGRLGCISFGCCYGKPMEECSGPLVYLVGKRGLIFRGKTKKVSYEGGLEGREVFPVQPLTTVVFVATGIMGLICFIQSWFTAAFLVAMIGTQGWRAYSETLRADYRGGGAISAYQIMALIAIVYSSAIAFLLPPSAGVAPDLKAGLVAVWTPGMMAALQGLGIIIFLYTGRSMVTGSEMRFFVHQDRI
jgi:hypothetical protein